jgi:hypothetical protein
MGIRYRAAAAVGGAICNLPDYLEPRLASVQLLPGERHTARLAFLNPPGTELATLSWESPFGEIELELPAPIETC